MPRPLTDAALQAALLDGLVFYFRATGIPMASLHATEVVAHQLAAITRAADRVTAPNVVREHSHAG